MADAAHKATDRTIKILENRIKRVYADAQKELGDKTQDFWERHEERSQKYLAQVKAGKITPEQYQAWMQGQVFQGEQWAAKQKQIAQILTHADQVAQQIINGEIHGVFANNANFMFYVMEHGTGINFGFGLFDSASVARLLRDQPRLLPKYKLDIPKDRRWNKSLISQQITQGIIQGEDIRTIAKRMELITDRDKNLCLTRARTAMTGAQNAGRQEAIHQANGMGIHTKKEWLSTLDHHTRIQHAKLDGQQVEESKSFKIDGYTIRFPGDPLAAPAMVYNCRCTMVASVIDYPDEYNAPRYDNIDGKPIKGMSYNEWLKAKGGTGLPGMPVAKPPVKAPVSFMGFRSDKAAIEYGLKNYSDWRGTLSKSQLDSLEEYTLDSTAINKYLRTGKAASAGKIKGQISDIDKALGSIEIPDDITVYRGVSDSFFGVGKLTPESIKENLIGKEFTEKGFMSTSLRDTVAEAYRGGDNPIIKINVPKGTHGAYADLFEYTPDQIKQYLKEDGTAGNMEMLLDRGYTLKITGYKQKVDKYGKKFFEIQADLLKKK